MMTAGWGKLWEQASVRVWVGRECGISHSSPHGSRSPGDHRLEENAQQPESRSGVASGWLIRVQDGTSTIS